MSLFKFSEEMIDSDNDDGNVTVHSNESLQKSSSIPTKRKKSSKLSTRIEELKQMVQVLESALKDNSGALHADSRADVNVQPKKRGRKFKPTLFDNHLRESVKNHGYNWSVVATELNRPISSVRSRWPRLFLHLNEHNDNLQFANAEYGKKGTLVVTWSDEMESKLKDAVVAFGKDWVRVSKYCGFGFDKADYEQRWESLKCTAA